MPHRDFEHLSPWKQLLIAAGIGVTGLVGFSQRDKLPWPPFNKADSSLEDTVKDASCGRHGSGTSASPDGYERRMINGDKWRFTPNASKLMDAYFRAIADVQGQPLTESFIYLLCTLADTNGDKIIKDTEAQALCNRFLGKYGHKSGNIAPTNLYLPCTQRAEFFPRETASEFLLLCHAGSAQWVATYDAYV